MNISDPPASVSPCAKGPQEAPEKCSPVRKIFYLSWLSLMGLMALLIRQRYELEAARGEAEVLAREVEAA